MSYEGAEPYIFVSYSRADGERVRAIVAAMKRRGYRVWYDKGINAGEQWTETLARKIAECGAFMPFISRAFLDSKYCRKEVVHADKKDRTIVPVRLDESELSGELEFLFGNPQQIRPAPDETADAFAVGLDAAPLLRPCRAKDAETLRAEIVTLERPDKPSLAFVGREKQLRDIRTAFRNGAQAVDLYGMGGIGKSEICRKLFWEYAQEPGKIGWAMWRGSLKDTFYGQFPGIDEPNAGRHLRQVTDRIRALGRGLLMFLDNADNLSETDQANLSGLGCRWLITSRQPYAEHALPIKADALSLPDCRKLYRRSFRKDPAPDDNDAVPDAVLDELLNLAGRHTLAVKLLARTQRANHFSAERLLAKLKETGFDLRGKIKYRHNPEQARDGAADEKGEFIEHMSRIFALSNLRGMEDGEAALRVLQGMSLLATNTPIACETLRKWLELDDFDGLNCAVEAGWLNETPDAESVWIHPVIAAVVRHDAMPDAATIDALARRLYEDMIVGTGIFTEKLPVLEHAIALDKAAGALRTENYGLMLGQMGYLLNQQADYKNALAYLKKSVAIKKETLGEEHREIANTYNEIGTVYKQKNDYTNALKWYKKALWIWEKALGTDHPDTAIVYNNIGTVYDDQGEYASALEWHQKALQVKEIALGIDHPLTAISYNNIGTVYLRQGDYFNALEWYKKALWVFENASGMNHPNTAGIYHNIGKLYFEQGDYAKALNWLEKAYTINLKILGPEHPNTKITQKWLDETKRRLSGEE